jgi:hypothetical protein
VDVRRTSRHQSSLCVRLPSGQLAHAFTTPVSQSNSLPQTRVTLSPYCVE